ncbi:MAG: transglutaminase domain-containing protein, partial [Defluviitaleaceae bacterium]|nr:transglutaminase domain-containing protein [Defluviitaleaceae bacterium]
VFVLVPFVMFIRVFFVLGLLRLIFINKYTLISAAAVVGVALVFMLIGVLAYNPDVAHGNTPVFFRLIDFISSVVSFVTGFEPYQAVYGTFIQWSVAVGFAVFVFAFGFLWFNYFALLAISAVTFGLVLNSGFFFYNLSFYAFVFCIIAFLVRHLNWRIMKQGGMASPFALYALPFTAICLALAIALPAPTADFRENFINRPFTALNRNLQEMFHPRHFSLAQTGFGTGTTRRLGGNVTANYDRVLRVNHPGPVYLSGNIFDQYTGYSWQNTLADGVYVLDFGTTMQNAELLERQSSLFTMWVADGFFDEYTAAMNSLRRMFYANPTNVAHFGSFEHFLTHFGDEDGLAPITLLWGLMSFIPSRPLFTDPEKPVNLTYAFDVTLDENTLVVDHIHRSFTVFTTGIVSDFFPPEYDMNFIRNYSGSVQAEHLMRRWARYFIIYADLPEHINREELIATSYPGVLRDVYDRVRQAQADGFDASVINFGRNDEYMPYYRLLSEYLIPRADRINEIYTTLPENLPQRIIDLAELLVQQAGAETTLEKVMTINSFLRDSGNFSYTLTPGNTPAGRDFVDHFLFDIQEGYCTFFASAFVVMARALGIPTRYVEGFIVTGEANQYGYHDVLNRSGHAWAEVYFEGFGWHIFDPTPPDAIFAPGYVPEDLGPDFHFLNGDYVDWDQFLDGMYYNGAGSPYDRITPNGDAGAGPSTEADQTTGLGRIMINSIITVLALIAAIFAARVAYVKIRDARVERKDNNEAVQVYFQRLLRYLYLFNYKIGDHETVIEFADRVNKKVGSFQGDRITMESLARTFSRARYSPQTITDQERHQLQEAVVAMDRRLLDYMGMRKYILHRYVKIEV